MVNNLERIVGPYAVALVLSGCPTPTDDDTTPSADDDTSPIADDDSVTPDDDTTGDDDSITPSDDDTTYENHAPHAIISAPLDGETVTQNQLVTFNGCTSYDKDGDSLNYNWDFGDGQSYAGAKCSAEHTYTAAAGTKVVRLRVQDPQGANHEVSLELLLEEEQPTNQPPVAIVGGPYNYVVGQYFILDFGPLPSGTGSYDPDGQIIEYSIDWGDGQVQTYCCNTFAHVYPSVGIRSITLTVEDNEGAIDSDITTVSIN